MAKKDKTAFSGISEKMIICYEIDLGVVSQEEHERLVSSAGVAVPSCMMGFLVYFNAEATLDSGRPVMAEQFLSQLWSAEPGKEPMVVTLKESSSSCLNWSSDSPFPMNIVDDLGA